MVQDGDKSYTHAAIEADNPLAAPLTPSAAFKFPVPDPAAKSTVAVVATGLEDSGGGDCSP